MSFGLVRKNKKKKQKFPLSRSLSPRREKHNERERGLFADARRRRRSLAEKKSKKKRRRSDVSHMTSSATDRPSSRAPPPSRRPSRHTAEGERERERARAVVGSRLTRTRRIPKLRAESQQIAAWKLLYRVQHPARYVSRMQTIPSPDVESSNGDPCSTASRRTDATGRSGRRPVSACGKSGSCDLRPEGRRPNA